MFIISSAFVIIVVVVGIFTFQHGWIRVSVSNERGQLEWVNPNVRQFEK